MNTDNYMQRRATVQQNYIFELREQAINKGDVPKDIGASNFMLGYYFKLGYDEVFREYWQGTAHKVAWQGLGVQVDLGARIEKMQQVLSKPEMPKAQPYVFEGGVRE